ncbi:non-hydrolyzing UDP-N-acetylglucosamine 2-epimerase [Methanobrevibacter filiformis]|uniref:UDP-2,3-diacetamido-2,3-dideoxy-D-glucuronate 2-epimerase n=1 Tax=Methanobrevibacter filiformis TaxID=55758 RepID=A0A166A850_9EURY|nr:UDP-N-acetylglucosamine 2-epimerase (non-hydrolyzing) [Methanobrevibacter filiformis]KZX11699.1 UDP-2,3-diacetamido-2,3-dideoxy-D-glucuronate 2-epimerase [Methanobrevibacter filiformis]
MKIAIVLGTRPEIIKMSPVIDEIESQNIELVLIHTGQHYDSEMSDQFFLELELPTPNFNIGVGSGSHGQQTGKMMEGIEEVLVEEKPDMLLVQGDTNAVLAGALVASKLHIPVGHVEAGLRSFDDTMPEEINRKTADICSNLYFVPTTQSAINLAIEGISRYKIAITGNTVVDACFRNLKIAEKRLKSAVSSDLQNLLDLDNILTLTMHRAENVDNKERVINIINALEQLKDLNIIFPIHPRTANRLKEFNLFDKLKNLENVHLIKPVGYLDFLLLQSKSLLILTDSGGLQEEAITLNIPALTLRYNTERPETVSEGGNILVGSNTENIVKMANKILNNKDFSDKMKSAKNPYGDGDSGKQIIDIILNSYNNGKLKIDSPSDIMINSSSKIAVINEDTTVSDFEKENNALIQIIYNKNDIEFPEDNINLKDKFILYSS